MSTSHRLLTLGLLVVCLTLSVVLAAEEDEDYFQVTTIAPGLLLLSTDQGSYSNNSLVFSGEDGLLLVDTHHGADVEDFKKFIDGLGFGAPKYIISTHRHQEHIGGNHLWGSDPVVVGHHLLAEKMRSGTYLFNGYPPASFPDITFKESLEITFNGELIRLVNIGGSHDDNEIMVHFTSRDVAHISSVVNGFNFPSVDSDGDVLMFESMTRKLMTLVPKSTRLVSGHHGKARGFDVLGTWDQLPAYADMMKATVEIVRQNLAEGKTTEEMQEAGVLVEYQEYAGSYVDTNGWIKYVVDVLTVPKETRDDICKPVYTVWQEDGAEAAVDRYRDLLSTQEDKYDFNEYVLMSIGSNLYVREMYDDAVVFLLGCLDVYPEAEYAYYTQYLVARSYQKQDRIDKATEHCEESVRLNPDFASAADLMEELTGKSKD
jgi:glyoxylase-like metal-dependent hydrolase (beta-lactamase superfamily II)